MFYLPVTHPALKSFEILIVSKLNIFSRVLIIQTRDSTLKSKDIGVSYKQEYSSFN